MYYEHVLVRMHTLIFIDYPQLGLRPLPSSPDPSLKFSSYFQKLIKRDKAEQRTTSRASLSTLYTKDKVDEEEEPF